MPRALGAPQNTVTSRRAISARSTPSSAAGSLSGVPAATSATATHSEQASSTTGATRTPSTGRSALPTRRCSAASCSKSSSSTARSRSSRISGPTSSVGKAALRRAGHQVQAATGPSARRRPGPAGRPSRARVRRRAPRGGSGRGPRPRRGAPRASPARRAARARCRRAGIRHDVSARAEAIARSTGSRIRSGSCSATTTPSSRATATCTVRRAARTPRAVSSSRQRQGARLPRPETVVAVHRLAIPMPRYAPVDPQQSFPALEEEILERWRERDVFHESIRRREGAEPYVFYEGPPTANGRPGSHHVLSRVFKDVFPRYRTMRGRLVHRKGGWDCHGLPVELEIEKELGLQVQGRTSSATAWRSSTPSAASRCCSYIDEWNELTERIGFWIDTDDAYYTLDDDYIESVWWSLKQVWDKGLLYEGHKVVPYCPRCGTALSSHEVALGYKDVVDPSVYVRFPVQGRGGRVAAGLDHDAVDAACSNAALAVDPDVRLRARPSGRRALIVAEALVERVLGEGAEIVDRVPGSELVGTGATSRRSPTSPTTARGATPCCRPTSCPPRTAPAWSTPALAFGEDDFRLARSNGLTIQNPVRPRRHLRRAHRRLRRPLRARTPTPTIVEALRESGRLLRAEDYEHSYPHCWRCETPLLYYAKSSWYVRTTERQGRAAGLQRGGHLVPRAHQARALRQLAGEQRGLGPLPRALLGHAAADLALRRRRGGRLRGLARRAGRAGRRGAGRPAPALTWTTPPSSATARRSAACPT